jgi:hypothetical protein
MNARAWLVSNIFFCLWLAGPTSAQTSVEPLGIPVAAEASTERHVGANGKPCITIVEIHAKSQINPDFYEHWIKASNRCGLYIKLRVCHHGTEQCMAMTVPPWESKNGLLGMSPTMADLKYETRERF